MGTLLKLASLIALAVGMQLSASTIASATAKPSLLSESAFNRLAQESKALNAAPDPNKPPPGGSDEDGGTKCVPELQF